MSMHARFGLALVAGLILGLLVVGSTTLYPASQLSGAASLQRAAIYSVYTSTSTVSTSGSGVPATIDSNKSGGASFTTTSSTNPAYSESLLPSGSPAYASQLHTIVSQPSVLTLFVLLPVLAAVFFGAILYRSSLVREQEEGSTAN